MKFIGRNEWTATPYYLSIPINLGYRFRLSNSVNLRAEAGVSVGAGLFGGWKSKRTMDADNSISYEDGSCFDNLYHRMSIGWQVGVGVDLCRNWQVNVGYHRQFNNMLSDKYWNLKNSGFSIGVAYMF